MCRYTIGSTAILLREIVYCSLDSFFNNFLKIFLFCFVHSRNSICGFSRLNNAYLAIFEPILVKYVLNMCAISNLLVISVLCSLIIIGDNYFILFLDTI